MQLLGHETNINFIGRVRFFAVVSAILVVASIVLIFTRGLNFGIDFAGGYEIQMQFPKPVEDAQIRALIDPLGIGDARVQRFGDASNNEFLILIREHGTITDDAKSALYQDFIQLAGTEDEILNWSVAQSGENLIVAFKKPIAQEQVTAIIERHKLEIKKISRGEREDRPEYTVELVSIADQIQLALRQGMQLDVDTNAEAAAGTLGGVCGEGGCSNGLVCAGEVCQHELVKRVEFVGPQVGEQLRTQGIMAVLYALIFILLYIAVRFDLFFSPGAVVALVHDVFITLGIFSVFQLEFNLPIVAAILALIGYSLNDTIVVYDRIRENALRLRGRELHAMVNTSINQTLSRTLLTSGTTLIVVGALLVWGGGIIRDFSIALAIGVGVGTYSSVFIASPVYIAMRERFKTQAARTDGSAAAA